MARCARFSADGRFVATGSSDTSIKLFEVGHCLLDNYLILLGDGVF